MYRFSSAKIIQIKIRTKQNACFFIFLGMLPGLCALTVQEKLLNGDANLLKMSEKDKKNRKSG